MSIDHADEDMGIPDDLIVGGREKERCRGIVYFRLLAFSAEVFWIWDSISEAGVSS
ncbi:hypothetical protein FHT86_003389 [Rhizobium sp. BK313]|nr:hypothetical protein [Rhizobium sp. BK313]